MEAPKLNLVEILRLLELVTLYEDEKYRKKLEPSAIEDAIEKLKETEKKLSDTLQWMKAGLLNEKEVGSTTAQLQSLLSQVQKDKSKAISLLSTMHGTSSSSKPSSDSTPKTSAPRAPTNDKHSGYQPLPFVEHATRTPIRSYVPPPDFNSAGPPEIPDEEIIYDEEDGFIGEGSYGLVYRGICRGKPVAIKVPKKQLNARQLEQFRHEVAVMSKIFHPNVVLFMGACTSPTIKIVTELCVTDVEKLLRNTKIEISMYDRMHMAKGAALGMNWLHGICNITHRDLKPANLLIAEDGTVKVTDFGFGKYFEVGTTFKGRAKGTPLWMAPEVMMGQETNEKRDVYSFGIILWEFVCRRQPFQEYKDWKTFKHAVCVEGKRPIIPPETYPSLRYLIERCWHADFRQRPGFPEVIFRLNEVIVDYAIDYPEARAFWKEEFLLNSPTRDLEEDIPWEEFVNILSIRTGISETEAFEPLFPFLCERPQNSSHPDLSAEPKVNIRRFNVVVNWFGPFFLPQHARKILDTVQEIVEPIWFHGEISQEEAISLLECRSPNTFLVRLSSTAKGKPFTLSIITSQTNIDHRRIGYTYPGNFEIRLDDQPCPKTRCTNSIYCDT